MLIRKQEVSKRLGKYRYRSVLEVRASAGRHAVEWAAGGGGGVGGGDGWAGGGAAPLIITQVHQTTYLQVQAQGDEALLQHIQPVEVVSLAHKLLLAVGMVLQGDQAAAQQIGLPLGHQSI